MDKPKKQDTEVPADTSVEVACGSCSRETHYKVLAETRTHHEYGAGAVDYYQTYQIVQCNGCLTISFREISECSEDMDYDEEGQAFLKQTVRLFPNRVAGRPEMDNVEFLPQGVYRIYQETHAALCAELPIMAGFGLRAIVEAVCKEEKIGGGNLQEKIDQLVLSGHVSTAGGKILHSLRFMGNAAAHQMKAHSQREINAAFNVIEHMLQGVYILPKMASELPSK